MADDGWEDIKPQRPAANNSVEVTITESHIRFGIRGDLFKDAAALAIKAATNADWAMVGWGYAKTGHPNEIVKDWISYDKSFTKWMKEYDYGKTVSPITFTLILDRAVDRTPKASNRKLRRQLPFLLEEQRRSQKVSR